MFVQELRQIPQPRSGCHPDDHAHPLNTEVSRAPRQSSVSQRSLTLMDHRADGRKALRWLLQRLNMLLLAAVFSASAADGKECGTVCVGVSYAFHQSFAGCSGSYSTPAISI
eukprot:3666231-Pyramimonas_sp.AAC.1